MIPGDVVRMTRRFRKTMRWNGSRNHIREFGRCIGVIESISEHGDMTVRWFPSLLCYSYLPTHLEPR